MRARFARPPVATWMAVLALAVQLVTPALYAPMRFGALPGFVGDLLAFCQFHESPAAGHHHHEGDHAPSHPGKKSAACPVLQGLQATSAGVPALAVVLPPPRPIERLEIAPQRQDAPRRLLSLPHNPRAPPLHA
jgi:hypothetical protein